MKRIICYIIVMTRLKNVESERSSIEDGHISQWAEGRKMGAGGEKRRACHPPSAKLALSPSPSPTLFFCSTLFFPPPASYFRPTAHTGVCVCMDMCLSECVLEVRFGARAIKALLKHFWCCWLMLKLKEGEEREKEKKREKREGGSEGKWDSEGGSAHTQWLSWPAQWSAGSLSILWAQRCEMSQQPNSNIKLSWAAEGKSRTQRCGERCLLLTLSPSPDLHSSKPFKNPLKTDPFYTPAHIQWHLRNTHAVALLKFWPAAELHLERFSKI